MTRSFRWPALAPVLLTAAILLAPAKPASADGAFAVDSSGFGNPGECKFESWVSFASNHDFMAVAAPTCVVKLGIPVEFSGQLVRSRADAEWGTSGSAKTKINLIPAENHPFGLGISAGGSWDLITGVNTSGNINVPVTVVLHDTFRINVNGGWLYDNVAKISYATWGAGFEWEFVKRFTLIGEAYGQVGRLPAVEEGDPPPPNSIREPRLQAGLRFTPQEKMDIDLIWGRNITGENANWVTLGLNLRF